MGLVFIGVSTFAFFGVLAGMLFMKILGMYIEGDISGGQAIVMLGGYVGLLVLIITVDSFVFRGMAICLLIAAVALLPVLRDKYFVDRGNRIIDQEKLEKYYDTIKADPTNLAARTRFAETLYKLGHLDEAIEQMSYVVEVSPKSEEEKFKLKYWLREKDERKVPPKKCPSCGQPNDPSRTRCAHCEGELSAHREVAKWLKKGAAKQIAITSGIAMGVVSVVLVVLAILPLPIRIGIVALILIIVICAEYLYWSKNLA